MKIRIQGNTIRLRLTQADINQLSVEGEVKQLTVFGEQEAFQYSIALNDSVNEVSGKFVQGHIKIDVPIEIGRNWIETIQTGIENKAYTNQESGLKILIEKDFQCLHERKHEDESDAFPNPLAG